MKEKSFKGGLKQILWTFSLFSEYRLRIIGYAILIIVKTLIDLSLTYAVGSVIDYIVSDDMTTLIRFVVIFVACFVVKLIVTYITNRLNVFNYTAIHKNLTLALYDKTLNADWESLEKHHSGDLLTRLSKDATTVAGNINGLLPTFLADGFKIFAAVAVVVYFDYSILIVMVLAVPLVYLSTKLFAGKVLESQRKGREAESNIMLLNKETFHNMQAVKAFGLFDVFHKKMDERAENRKKCDIRSNLMYMISWVITQALGLITIVIAGAWMIYRVHTNYITVGNIASMAALAVSAATALSNLFSLMPTLVEFITASERIEELLEIPDEPDIVISPEKKAIIDSHQGEKMSIKLNGISFHYHTGPNIFEDADLEASSGEIVAMVGPSGEGKTTMLRLVLGIVRAQSGDANLIWEDGKKIHMGTPTRSMIAYVPQGNTMMSGTIADNMRIIKPDATDEEIIEALRMSCAYDFVKKLPDGINHMIGESGLGFSEGQNQRLAIARAILRKTPILLLDEATSALDVVTEREVLRNLMTADTHRICLLTTHRPSVLSMCNRVYRISDKKTRVINDDEVRVLMNEF
ncbi:ABC transporter ATP-binding protein [Butyrivibrio sp. MB2005]|uniref:ABC transporter ATP-binding protein n=1 Tax=Butyrivibrio sp. MB2005 TaxID=1280678 RepID=UPI0003FC5F9C|nr:ABC transporter ATP-binding protein [Butyrivibrio sp. MB2005]